MTVGGELVLATGIFALTGALTGLPPAGGMQPATTGGARPLVVIGNDFATTTRVRLEVTPGTVGPNRFVARVTDYDTGQPVPADRVSLEFSLPGDPDVGSSIPLERREDGSWTATSTALAIVGDWRVRVLVQDPTGSTEVPLEIRPRVLPPRIEVSQQQGQPDLYTITFSTGVQIQTYVDPGSPGMNQLHVTAFDASGQELPLAQVKVQANGPHGPAGLEMLRFSPGHFVANLHIVPGKWAFLIRASGKDGAELSARFEETFQG
jgi:nitrogen fixation protein FixH